jgi:hypothetical protein
MLAEARSLALGVGMHAVVKQIDDLTGGAAPSSVG